MKDRESKIALDAKNLNKDLDDLRLKYDKDKSKWISQFDELSTNHADLKKKHLEKVKE